MEWISTKNPLLWVVLSSCLLFGFGELRGQDATVVFYSHAGKGGLFKTDEGIFCGAIYKKDTELFSFLDGRVTLGTTCNNRVLVMHFRAGAQTFSARWSGKPSRKFLTLNMEPGKTYFVRAQAEARGFLEYSTERGRLDEVPCDVAHKETERSKPVVGHRISTAAIPNVSTDQTLPPC